MTSSRQPGLCHRALTWMEREWRSQYFLPVITPSSPLLFTVLYRPALASTPFPHSQEKTRSNLYEIDYPSVLEGPNLWATSYSIQQNLLQMQYFWVLSLPNVSEVMRKGITITRLIRNSISYKETNFKEYKLLTSKKFKSEGQRQQIHVSLF